MTVRMKVKCTSVEMFLGSHYDQDTKTHTPTKLYSYKFAFVTGSDSPENAAFWSATPSGQFSISTVLTEAFELGSYYYLDAILAPEAAQGGQAY